MELTDRHHGLRRIDWDGLFVPKGVAVIGASDREGSQQRAQWLQVRERLGARGAKVVPVHPKKRAVLGVAAYPSVSAVPFQVDLAIVLVSDALPVLEECLRAGVRFAVVFAAGFAEVGTPGGDAAQARLEELAAGPMRVLGPNTNLNIFQPWRQDLPGRKMAIITQSGFQGRPISQGEHLGVPIQSWATVGNEADVEFADFVGYYAQLPDTGVIVGYVEGFRSGRSLMNAAELATAHGVPIVLIKVGRSDEGRRMAQAHTGHLTGSDAVHDAVFEQCGITRVDDIDELVEIGGMFCHLPLLPAGSGGGVAIYAMSGGTAAHVVDMCAAAGVRVPRLEEVTISGLAEYLPWYLRRDNPVDSGGVVTSRPEGRAVLDLLVADRNTDVILAPITGVFPGMSDALAKDLVELHGEGRKPVVAVWNSPLRDDPAYRSLCDHGVPLFHSFGAAVKGLKALVEFSGRAARRRSAAAAISMPAGTSSPAHGGRQADVSREVAALLGKGGQLDEVGSKRLLALYGVPTVPERVVVGIDEAVAAADELGYPVVVKAVSPQIAHKSDLGLVVTGVGDPDRLREVWAQLVDAGQRSGATQVAIVVQAMVTDSVAEVILGMTHQPPFGATVLFGLGGVLAEVFHDVAFGVPPFDRDHAERMVHATRSGRILEGVRGRPPGDIAAVVDAILALGRLAVEQGERIAELDVNPLMVRPAGHGVVAVDALVVAERIHEPPPPKP